MIIVKQTAFWATCPPCLLDLVLLACNWSTMGDSFFVCHHLAALYAYGYVLVSLFFQAPECLVLNSRHTLDCLSVCWVISDTWRAPLLCQLSSHFRAVHTICEPKVSQSSCEVIFCIITLCKIFSLTFLQVVLWGIKVPTVTSAGGDKWHCYGGCVLPSAYCCHAILLGQCLRHFWDSRLRAAGLRGPSGLDHLLHCPRYLKHCVDV